MEEQEKDLQKLQHLRRTYWPILQAHNCFFPVNKHLAKSLAGSEFAVLYIRW